MKIISSARFYSTSYFPLHRSVVELYLAPSPTEISTFSPLSRFVALSSANISRIRFVHALQVGWRRRGNQALPSLGEKCLRVYEWQGFNVAGTVQRSQTYPFSSSFSSYSPIPQVTSPPFLSLLFVLSLPLSLSVRFYSKQNFPSFLNRQRSYHEFPAGKINIVRLRKNFIFLRCLLFFSSPSHTYLQPQKSSARSLRLFHPPVAPWPASSGCSIYFHRNTREQSRKRRFFFHFFTPSGTTDRKFYPR